MTDDDETTSKRFEEFHRDNPMVYATLCRLARSWVRRHDGRRKLGINSLVEVVRWEFAMQTTDTEYKINNNYAPYYARLLMEEQSDLWGLFDTRASAADEWIETRAA